MKNKVILILIIIAALSVIIGLIGKLSGSTIVFANATWHMFAQTCLLAAIAFGIGKLLDK
jgi:TRAP-type mannitol/chloroaromatic compound transport system permease small subunit